MSVLPPGGKETTNVIGPLGNSCAKPRPPSANSPASANTTRTARCAIMVRFFRCQDYKRHPRGRTSRGGRVLASRLASHAKIKNAKARLRLKAGTLRLVIRLCSEDTASQEFDHENALDCPFCLDSGCCWSRLGSPSVRFRIRCQCAGAPERDGYDG